MPTPAEELSAILDRLEDLDSRGAHEDLAREVARARRRHPESLELMEWDAMVAVDDDRPERALELLDAVIARAPRRFWPRRERASVLMDLWRFDDARSALQGLLGKPRALPADERAGIHHELGLCADRLGDLATADAELARAARLAPAEYPPPLRLSPAEFATLVELAVDRVPRRFARHLAQVAITIEQYPADPAYDPFLLGLYVGLPRSQRSAAEADHLDTIVVYQRPHELRFPERGRLAREVRNTVLHEIGHHFGLEHGQMGDAE